MNALQNNNIKMKTGLVLAVLGLAAIALTLYSATSAGSSAQEQFDLFVQSNGANYKNIEEYNYRFGVFKENLKIIDNMNRLNPRATFAVNKFADRTPLEMKKLASGRRSENYRDPCRVNQITGTPKLVDWTYLMGKARDQGNCGGCWAFATSAVVEGRLALAQGRTQVTDRLSPQYLIDCDDANDGCDGGFEAWGFEFLEKHKLCYESDYPYVGKQGRCKGDCESEFTSGPCSKIPKNRNDLAVIELQDGPVDVAIDATSVSFYSSGIMSSCRNRNLNHAVTLVGYDPNDGENGSVTIRNSWGAGWGEQGNFRLEFEGHLCGWDEDAHAISYK